MSQRVAANLARSSVSGAALALVVDGEVVWAEGFGTADVETGRRVHADTIFPAGSRSKPVTAWAAMSLASDGLIDLDAPVQTQIGGWSLPDPPFDADGVTPRRLLAHACGWTISRIAALAAILDDLEERSSATPTTSPASYRTAPNGSGAP